MLSQKSAGLHLGMRRRPWVTLTSEGLVLHEVSPGHSTPLDEQLWRARKIWVYTWRPPVFSHAPRHPSPLLPLFLLGMVASHVALSVHNSATWLASNSGYCCLLHKCWNCGYAPGQVLLFLCPTNLITSGSPLLQRQVWGLAISSSQMTTLRTNFPLEHSWFQWLPYDWRLWQSCSGSQVVTLLSHGKALGWHHVHSFIQSTHSGQLLL